MPSWPATLPQRVLVTASRETQAGVIRSQMDTGPAKQRARFTAVSKEYNASLILTGAELAIFRNFYENTLSVGALAFDWVDPFTDAPASVRFRAVPSETMTRSDADPDKRLFSVTLPLEVLA